ncbi:3136_t:CDS:1, partial [Cetraspora pellucida]
SSFKKNHISSPMENHNHNQVELDVLYGGNDTNMSNPENVHYKNMMFYDWDQLMNKILDNSNQVEHGTDVSKFDNTYQKEAQEDIAFFN